MAPLRLQNFVIWQPWDRTAAAEPKKVHVSVKTYSLHTQQMAITGPERIEWTERKTVPRRTQFLRALNRSLQAGSKSSYVFREMERSDLELDSF